MSHQRNLFISGLFLGLSLFISTSAFALEFDSVRVPTINGNEAEIKLDEIEDAFEAYANTRNHRVDDLWFNDDGSITLKYPQFKHQGEWYKINNDGESYEAVCHLFGFEDTLDSAGKAQTGYQVVLDRDGRFVRRLHFEERVNESGVHHFVTCSFFIRRKLVTVSSEDRGAVAVELQPLEQVYFLAAKRKSKTFDKAVLHLDGSVKGK